MTIASIILSALPEAAAQAATTSVSKPWWVWVIFHVVLFTLLAFDLGIGQRKVHTPTFKEALGWVAFYVAIALVYCGWLYFSYGTQTATLFLTGYIVEASLSVDNLFVFLVVFTFFAVPSDLRHYLLFFGVLGAIIFRGVFIGAGTLLVSQFSWIFYVFGVFLIITAWKLLKSGDTEIEPEKNPVIQWMRKRFPIHETYVGKKFILRKDGKTILTPLLLVLVYIEISDVIFAVDSIPAIFAITSDPFIVYTSNIFAILGLRSLYFVLDRILPMFKFIKPALSIILFFIGAKMLLHHYIKIDEMVSLAVIVVLLSGAVLLSMLKSASEKRKLKS